MVVDSLQNLGRRASGQVSSFVFRDKKKIEITFDGQTDFVPTYTTLEKIQGNVHIKFDKDTPFDELDILFLGLSDTWTDNVHSMTPQAGKIIAKHHFLRSVHPVQRECLPRNGVALANVTYTHPFSFTVPERLLDVACTHKTLTKGPVSDPTRDEHCLVPPSLGDPLVSGIGSRLLSDMAPDMAKIIYTIKVVAKKAPTTANHRMVELAHDSQKIRIIPAKEAQPPLEVSDNSKDYRMRAEKNLRNTHAAKVGKIIAEARQPPALMLPSPKMVDQDPDTPSTMLNLRFDPKTANNGPPSITNLSVKLKVFTFFSTRGFPDIPSKAAVHTERNHYSEEVTISNRPMDTVEWVRHDPSATRPATENERQLSVGSVSSNAHDSARDVPRPSHSYSSSLPYYTAHIVVPINLGRTPDKAFVPTFHSCYVSRHYALRLHVNYEVPKIVNMDPSLTLKVPIQIGSHGIPDARPEISEEEMAAIMAREQRQLDDAIVGGYLLPRRMTLADGEPVPEMERMRLMSMSQSSTEESRRPNDLNTEHSSSGDYAMDSSSSEDEIHQPLLGRDGESEAEKELRQRLDESPDPLTQSEQDPTLPHLRGGGHDEPINVQASPYQFSRHHQRQGSRIAPEVTELPSYSSSQSQVAHRGASTVRFNFVDYSTSGIPVRPGRGWTTLPATTVATISAMH